MKIKTGIDIMEKKRFLESYEKGGEKFSSRIFTHQELKQNSKEQLASIFSMKEAIIKALQLPQSSWQVISTNRKGNGKVECSFTDEKIARKIKSLDTSISHDGGFIIAIAAAILENE